MKIRINKFHFDNTQILLLSSTLFASTLLVAIFMLSMNIPGLHPIAMAALYIPDGVLLWLPLVILWPRFKWTESVVLSVVTIFFYCNILYFRNFGTTMSIQTMTLTPSIDGVVLRSALA